MYMYSQATRDYCANRLSAKNRELNKRLRELDDLTIQHGVLLEQELVYAAEFTCNMATVGRSITAR